MISERLLDVIRSPHVSEKAARTQELANQYVFEVARTATKADVKAAVEKLFNVKVESVQVLNVKGKTKGFRGRSGVRGGWRKAYVRLGEGQTIDLMAKA
ncbi:MAG: 50S ribosomal protein L23 [Gammaproteobacteria bacterium]|nr:50S ribosomal protein L23 [Gammaproteobacteria bacterium]